MTAKTQTIRFGMNTGCFINRYVEPESWARLVREDFGLDCVQLTTELIRPDLKDSARASLIHRTQAACRKEGIEVLEVFTDAFSRVNHLAHPIAEVRAHWLEWMKRAIESAAILGAESFGSHLAVLTVEDCEDPHRRKTRLNQVLEGWWNLSEHAKACGLKRLTWEPMSIRRELGETLEEAKKIQQQLSEHAALPILLCYDVDHGDISSPNPDDTDPYRWLEAFSQSIGSIHLKQSGRDKSGHKPFTPEHNANGRIIAEPFLEAVRALSHTPHLFLELSFREREPADSLLVPHVRASVEYWRPHLP